MDIKEQSKEESFFEIRREISEIRNLIFEINSNIMIIMTNSKSSKLNVLDSKLRQMKRLDVTQVEKILNCSRPWALEIMKKLSQTNPFYKFYPGSKEIQNPSRIVYLEEQKIEDDLFKVAEIVSLQKRISLAQICQHLGLELQVYIEYIRDLMKRLSIEYPGFKMEGEATITYTEPYHSLGDNNRGEAGVE